MPDKKIIDMDDLMLDNLSIDSLVSLPNVADETNDWKHKSGNAPTVPLNAVDDLDISSVDLSGLDPVREDYAPPGDTSNRFVYAEEEPAEQDEAAPASPPPPAARNPELDSIMSKYSGGFEVGTTGSAPSDTPAPPPIPSAPPPPAPTGTSGYSGASGLDFDLPPIRKVTIPDPVVPSADASSVSAGTDFDSALPPLKHVSVPSVGSDLPPLKSVSVPSPADSGLPPLKPVSVPNAADSALPPLKPVSVPNAADSALPPLKPVSVPNAADSALPPLKPVSVPNAADSGLPPLKPVSVPNAAGSDLPPLKHASNHNPAEDKNSVTIPGMGHNKPSIDDDLPPLKPARKEKEEKAEEINVPSASDIGAEDENSGIVFESPKKDSDGELPADMSDVKAPKLDDMMDIPDRKASFERPENKIEGMDDPFAKKMSAARRKKLEQGFDAPVVMKKVDPETYWEIEQNERAERAERGKKAILVLPFIFAGAGLLALIGNLCAGGDLMFGGISCALAVISALILGKGSSGAVRIVFAVLGLVSVGLGIYGIDFMARLGELKGEEAPITSLIAVITAILHAVGYLAVTVICFINKNIGEYYHSLKKDK